ncbi:AraC family transcriptional regulator [Burkholderia sp. D-99]|uniref:AraC family transcriptional regulator n=1 Tax=Burkholderia sp. D-99 TaxID=2717316 RepID=UPI0014235914|nr:AraC family transcriptional regulator [Burkholderia sp. D-99]NHV25871.1 AraC family transcriptional regulator [Burkholderia sp. D-99]
MSARYLLDLNWKVVLGDLHVEPQDLLRHARLPLDLFARARPVVTAEEYFRLWDSVGVLVGGTDFPLKIGQSVSVEAFNPLMFACLCSADLNCALQRFSRYKLLLGPLRLDVEIGDRKTVATFGGAEPTVNPPVSFVASEMVFVVHMARRAARQHVVPSAITLPALPTGAAEAEAFFGVPITIGANATLAFDAKVAGAPFLTANETIWASFEPDLKRRLGDLDQSTSFADRVRACLTERLASGRCSAFDVAGHLAVSQRTLQRRLRDEGTSFQAELNAVRVELARHYLLERKLAATETAFLLGYDEPNSFARAFQQWTGKTPEQFRREPIPLQGLPH